MRFVISSGALLRQLEPHRAAPMVQVAIQRGICGLHSQAATTILPVEARHDVALRLLTAPLLAALGAIEDQPITLDLHALAGLRNMLYAVRRTEDGQYEPLEFTL